MYKSKLVLLFICSLLLITQASITIPISGKNIKIIREGEKISYPTDAEVYGPAGSPLIPVYTASVLLPLDADITTIEATLSNISTEFYGKYDIEPAPPLATIDKVLWPKNRNIINGKDIDIYSKNEFYPKKQVEVVSVGYLNIFKIVDIRVYMAKYNPVSKDLYLIKNCDLNLNWKTKREIIPSDLVIPKGLLNYLNKTTINSNDIFRYYSRALKRTRNDKMVIMTTNSIANSSQKLSAFSDSKSLRGIDVEIITEDEWGGGTGSQAANNLRSWLQQNYQSMGIRYVLLIGYSVPDNGDVPMMMMQGVDYDPADICYAQLTGDPKSDRKCEVSTGRIPVYNSDISALDYILQKCIDYESKSEDEIEWRTNALFGAGGYDERTKADKLFEAMHNEIIVPASPDWTDYRIYGTNYGQPSGTPDKIGISYTIFTNQWKSDSYGLVEWGTHGAATLAQYVFASSYTTQVGDDYPAQVFCGSCSNATVTSSNNLTYSILKNCGIGSIGGTYYTYYSPGLSSFKGSGSDQGWIYEYGRAVIEDSLEMGDALNYLRGMPASDWSNCVPYVLYADPSLSIYTCNKKPFISVVYPNGGEKIEQSDTCKIKWTGNIKSNVKVELIQNGNTVKTFVSSGKSSGSFDWIVTEDVGSGYKIKVTALDTAMEDESNDAFDIVPEFIIDSFPYIQKFDDMDTGRILSDHWEQLNNDDIDWTVWTGPTPSKVGSAPNVTGPDADADGNGNYVYVEASDPNNPNKKAVMITPKFRLKNLNNPKLSFKFHMFSDSNTMGDLYLDVNADGNTEEGVIHITGNHGDEWHDTTLSLDDYTNAERVRFIFRGITGENWASDICIDNFVIEGTNSISNTAEKITKLNLNMKKNYITYSIPNNLVGKELSIKLYDIRGREIKTLFKGKTRAIKGVINLNNLLLGSNIYICKIKIGNQSVSQKIMIK